MSTNLQNQKQSERRIFDKFKEVYELDLVEIPGSEEDSKPDFLLRTKENRIIGIELTE